MDIKSATLKKRVYLCGNSEKRKNLWEKTVELKDRYSTGLDEVQKIFQNEVSYFKGDLSPDDLLALYGAINEDIRLVNYNLAKMEQLQKETYFYLQEIKKELEIFQEPVKVDYFKMLTKELAIERAKNS